MNRWNHCKICGDELTVETARNIVFSDLSTVDEHIRVCPKCNQQVKKFIAFQTFRNDKEDFKI